VGFDIDGDGQEDAFILLGGAAPTSFRGGPDDRQRSRRAAPLETVPLVGQPSFDLGSLGEPAPRG